MHSQEDNFQWKQYLCCSNFLWSYGYAGKKISSLFVVKEKAINNNIGLENQTYCFPSSPHKKGERSRPELLDTKCTCVNIPKGPTILHDGALRNLACKTFLARDYANNGKICQCAALYFTLELCKIRFKQERTDKLEESRFLKNKGP